jgi:tRNA(Ile)-lysidine synthetase-like protein
LAHSFTSHIATFIDTHQLLRPGDLIVVAVSGGPDSLALLHALVDLRARFDCSLHVVHLDHMLRGAESADEARFVAEIAKQWGVLATIESHDVGLLAHTHGLNLYAAGRAARYHFFARVATALGANAVAVAHTANDQAETVLMHLLRGAGAEGLAGMRPLVAWEQWRTYGILASEENPVAVPTHAPTLIRPLLATTRAAIEAYCAEQLLAPRHDPANDDTRHTRSHIRHNLLPQLIEYNPRIVEALGRTADTLASDHDLIEQSLTACWPQLANLRPRGVELDLAFWQSLHPALQRAAIRRAYTLLGGGATLGFADLERAFRGIAAGVGRVIELPGGIALTVGYTILTLGEVAVSGPQLLHEYEPLPIPGELLLAGGWRMLAVVQQHTEPNVSPWVLHIAGDSLTQPLIVRRRRAGDRITGRRGSRSIQDVMVDAKLPQALRSAWPLLVCGDQILWVVGVRAADRMQASDEVPVVRIAIIAPERILVEE